MSTTGFLSLPVDIYRMIQDVLLAGTRTITRDDVSGYRHPTYHSNDDFKYHTDILRPLMHTCRALRAAYVYAYYEHVEVCIVRTDRIWYKQLSERLERTARVLMHPLMQHLACNVRVFTVSLNRCNEKRIIPLFAKMLLSLPNLHTIQITHAKSQSTRALKASFKNKTLPGVQTVILPSYAHPILRACPKVRTAICNDGDGSDIISVIEDRCPHVEVIGGFPYSALDRLSVCAPQVREIFLNGYGLAHLALSQTVIFPNLVVIHLEKALHCRNVEREIEKSIGVAVAGAYKDVTVAKDVLRRTSATLPEKSVEVTWVGTSPEWWMERQVVRQTKTFLV